jgi:hypothetical protein
MRIEYLQSAESALKAKAQVALPDTVGEVGAEALGFVSLSFPMLHGSSA